MNPFQKIIFGVHSRKKSKRVIQIEIVNTDDDYDVKQYSELLDECCKSVIDSFEWWMATIWWHCLCVVPVAKHCEHSRREESETVESRGNEKQHYVQVGSNRRSWSP